MMRLLVLVMTMSVSWARQNEDFEALISRYGPAHNKPTEGYRSFKTSKSPIIDAPHQIEQQTINDIFKRPAQSTPMGGYQAFKNAFQTPDTGTNYKIARQTIDDIFNRPLSNTPTPEPPESWNPFQIPYFIAPPQVEQQTLNDIFKRPVSNSPTERPQAFSNPSQPSNAGKTFQIDQQILDDIFKRPVSNTPTERPKAFSNPLQSSNAGTTFQIEQQILDGIFKRPVSNTTPTERPQAFSNPLQSSNAGTTFQIEQQILDGIFKRPVTPQFFSNSATTFQIEQNIFNQNFNRNFTHNIGPTNNYPDTTTVSSDDDQGDCQCIPYTECDSNNIDDSTGIGVIQVRFGEEGCQESVEVCCKALKPTSSQPVLNPSPELKGCGYRNSMGIDFTLIGTAISGMESQFGEFPWVVALMNIFTEAYVGVGVLIHPQVVLTGAHIARRQGPSELKIRAGEWDTQTVGEPLDHQERTIQQIYIHPGFNQYNLVNDVAVLHLETPVELAEHINTICLADQGEEFGYSKNCVANGWGKDRFGNASETAVILKKIEVDMVDHSRCNMLLKRTRLGSRFNLHRSFVCAGGEEGEDTCTGDGGGPLACPIGNNRYKLAGMVAWGIGCGQKDVPGVYSSLPALRSWVDGKMRMLGYGTSSYTV